MLDPIFTNYWRCDGRNYQIPIPSLSQRKRSKKEMEEAEAFGRAFVRTVKMQDTSDPLVKRIFRN